MRISANSSACGSAILGAAFASSLAVSAAAAPVPQKMIVSFVSGNAIVLYADAGGQQTAGELKRSDVTLPLMLTEEAGEFGRVSVNGSSYWIDLRRVRVRAGVVAECLTQTRGQMLTAGIRGANEGCTTR